MAYRFAYCFLGEWCRHYNRKVFWENIDYSVISCHWDDSEFSYNDYNYMRESVD